MSTPSPTLVRPAARARAPRAAQVAAPALVALTTEVALRLTFGDAPVLGQRLAEAHGWLALLALLLTLLARPLRLLRVRRALGLSAFAFTLAHLAYAFAHVFGADLLALLFLRRPEQLALGLGALAALGLVPLALTSTNAAMRRLGPHWKALHRITLPLTLLAVLHTVWLGVHGGVSWASALLVAAVALTLWQRRRRRA